MQTNAARQIRLTVLIGLGAAALIGVVVWRTIAPPWQPPTFDGPAPERSDGGYLTIVHSTYIAAPPATVRAWTNDPERSLEDLVDFDGGFAPVVATHPLVGEWIPGEREGDRRRVEFADGHYLAEQVLIDTPERFRYMIWGFTSLQRFAVRHGVAEFVFDSEGEGTRLTWSYSFMPTSAPLAPAVQNFLDGTMSPMMRATLTAIREGVEGSPAGR